MKKNQKEGTNPPKKHVKLIKNSLIGTSALLCGILIAGIVLYLFLTNRIYPGISAAGINLSTLTREQSGQKLKDILSQRLNRTLKFNYSESTASSQKFVLSLSPESVSFDSQKIIDEAFLYGHKKIYGRVVNLPVNFIFNDSIDAQIKNIAQSIDQPPVDASLKVEEDQIIVSQSQNGRILDQPALKKSLTDYLNTGTLPDLALPIKTAQPRLSYESALRIKNRLDEIKLSPLKLVFKDRQFILDLNKILSLIDLQNSQSSIISGAIFNDNFNISSATLGNEEFSENKLTLNESKVKQYLKEIAISINREVQEPLLSVDPGSDPKKPKIKEFKPAQDGQTLLEDKAYQKLSEALLNPKQTIVALPVAIVPPKNQLVNDLGIKELIGRGISNFSGSIPNRIFNIGLAASRINGILVSPGEEFSFVNTVGDITAATGYKQAYVIKSGRTVLDDGGGVCQVSTTLFRAVLNSGLPVTTRTAHAYRVGYYEQGYPPGLDATIFYPNVDLRFKNDSPASVLIQSYINGYNLIVDFYGTSDGRIATLTKPVVTNQVPPPPELRQDDPTLPKGTVKQVDFSAWGANVIFNRTVLRNGETIINESFRSNFRPWQAIFLIGTKEG